MWNYFEVIKRQEVPDPFLGDIVLFLHLVPMIAALAVLPHLREDERDERIRMLDFTLLLIWWVFVYVYTVIPWQTVQVDEATYDANLNYAYLTEKVVFLIALAVLAYTAARWLATRLRTVARRQCTLRLQFLCRQLGHRSARFTSAAASTTFRWPFPWPGWQRLPCSRSASICPTPSRRGLCSVSGSHASACSLCSAWSGPRCTPN